MIMGPEVTRVEVGGLNEGSAETLSFGRDPKGGMKQQRNKGGHDRNETTQAKNGNINKPK